MVFYNKSQIIIFCIAYFQYYILVDHADFVRVKRSCVLTGIKNLIEIERFSSLAEFELSGDIFMRKVNQNQRKQKNVRDDEEFELNGGRHIEVQLY